MSGLLRGLASQAPQRCHVTLVKHQYPSSVDGRVVLSLREEWRVEEGWWSTPYRRRYLSVALADGQLQTIFEDRRNPGQWWRHGR